MSRYKFSIIIPVYNAGKYLAECIESCINQAPYRIGEDIEVICINDGSTDKSLDILREYEKKGVIVISQKNSGVSYTRNKGLDMARGEYIWFVDSDDLVCPYVLCDIYKQLQSNNVDGCAFRTKTVDMDFSLGSRIVNTQLMERAEPPQMNNACCLIIKREYIINHNIRFNTTMSYGEDTLFVFYLRLYNHRFIYYENELYYYRQVPSSAMHQKSDSAKERMLTSQLEMLNEYKMVLDRWVDEYNYGDAKPKERYYWTIQNILFSLLQFDKNKRRLVFDKLKEKGHYPYPIQWRRLFFNSHHIKAFLINLFCLFFPIEWYYRLLMRVFK